MSNEPLTALATKLRVGPPSIQHLIALLDQGEFIQEFVRLIEEFLPEHKQTILSLGHFERMASFSELFGQKYFPLDDFDEQDYSSLSMGIPIQRGGLTFDEFHEVDSFHTGMQLLMALVQYPYWGEDDGGVAMRVPLLELCAGHAGKATVKLIPPTGWTPEDLHTLLDGTRFEVVGGYADWIWHQTDLAFLDLTYEDEGMNGIPWSRENVEDLTRQHGLARQLMADIDRLIIWLEESPKNNFAELVGFILHQQEPKEQPGKTLAEVFKDDGTSEQLQT